MANGLGLKVLLVAEGSGGHLIPALEVAKALAHEGARIKVWYAQRRRIAPLAEALIGGTGEEGHAPARRRGGDHPPAECSTCRRDAIDVDPIPVPSRAPVWQRFWQCGQLWQQANRCFDEFRPDVVVGFGGWLSAPVMLAAHHRRIGCVLHEQNVVMGRANRWLRRWADRIAVSFLETQDPVLGQRTVVTGLPIRERIGALTRQEGATRLGLAPNRPTLLVLGGSQGSRRINELMLGTTAQWTAPERRAWQIVHLSGADEEARVHATYAAHGITASVKSFLADIEVAYAAADLVVGRAGASTIAELARCGLPALLIPYPYAGGHQRANAQVVEAAGGALVLEEEDTGAQQLLDAIRRILSDERLRNLMGMQMRSLHAADAVNRLMDTIVDVGQPHRRSHGPWLRRSGRDVVSPGSTAPAQP